jgi:hypothetical protein
MHKQINDPRAELERKKYYFFQNLAAKLNGAEERKAAAQTKRDRKAAKRLRDAVYGGVQPWQPGAPDPS